MIISDNAVLCKYRFIRNTGSFCRFEFRKIRINDHNTVPRQNAGNRYIKRGLGGIADLSEFIVGCVEILIHPELQVGDHAVCIVCDARNDGGDPDPFECILTDLISGHIRKIREHQIC